jgi:hypothetical protein
MSGVLFGALQQQKAPTARGFKVNKGEPRTRRPTAAGRKLTMRAFGAPVNSRVEKAARWLCREARHLPKRDPARACDFGRTPRASRERSPMPPEPCSL